MNSVIILAGGDGKRLNSQIPKQFIEIDHRKIIDFSIIEFIPVNMKILQLSRDGHIRVNFVKINNEWEGSFIVP